MSCDKTFDVRKVVKENPYEAGFFTIHYEGQNPELHWLAPSRPYNYEIDSPEFRKRTYPEPNMHEIILDNGRQSVGYP